VRRQRAFTLVELLVVIAVIALLMAILLPTLSKVRRQVKVVACQSNLKQWGSIFLMYADGNNGYMVTRSIEWPEVLRLYFGNCNDLLCCPMATKPVSEGGHHPFAAFSTSLTWEPTGGDYASYGINGWVCNPPIEEKINLYGLPTSNNWRKVDVKGASNIPLLLDSMWIDNYPDANDVPPLFDGDEYGSEPMGKFCINRHDGFINGVFLDFSVRKIGLKELWKLKWHRKYDINGPWTKDHVPLSVWPDWMKKFKDY